MDRFIYHLMRKGVDRDAIAQALIAFEREQASTRAYRRLDRVEHVVNLAARYDVEPDPD